MKQDQENFEALRKLMALKRHEVPPPGYFSRLPGTILSRIERGDGQLNFWERVAANFSVRPTFAYAFVLAACGALTASVYSVRTQSEESAMQPAFAAGWRPANSVSAFAAVGANANRFDPSEPLHVASWLGNTNPGAATPELMSLFAPANRAVPVSFAPHN